jgi:flagellar biosynthesis/type III secretory pathway M-ring protein FliF/YscJ
MTTGTIIIIACFAVAAFLVCIALAWVLLNKLLDKRRRTEAEAIRDNATERSREVQRREALAEETAATARAAQARVEADAARGERLQRQAQAHRSDAARAHEEVDQQFERADTIDPASQTRKTPRQGSQTRDTSTEQRGHAPKP